MTNAIQSPSMGENKRRTLWVDDIWDRAAKKAEKDGLTISEAVRALLAGYVAGDVKLTGPAVVKR